MAAEIYVDGTYGDRNPDWHTADSAWKAERIREILTDNAVRFASCVEVGCGAGVIIETLAGWYPSARCVGYDVSPDAAHFWPQRKHPEMFFKTDFVTAKDTFDLLLLIDVFEHVEDYLGFLRALSGRAGHFVFHIPLEMHVSAVLRDQHLHARQQVGHIHYFSKATALATLADAGFDVVESRFTKLSQQTVEGVHGRTRIANLARRGLEVVSQSAAAKLLGGYSLLVLARPKTNVSAQS
jgi:predicted TPR repeat methyltransferase